VPIDAPSEIVATPMVSPSLAPTWNEIVTCALSSLMPLNAAETPRRSISEASWLTSLCSAAWFCGESVPFLYCTASSRTRWSIECTSESVPSAVCTIETASCRLRCA